MTKLFKTRSHYFLSLLIILFIVSRLGYLNLPFYWDEAWSYAIAVFDMHNNGAALQKDKRYFLVKRFENRGAWVEFYRLKNPGNVIN